MTGMVYHPLADEWRLSQDTDVNYFATAEATPRGRIERLTGQ
jgi:2-polyprenyl-3-methyl-5-hydroxy-6-metoxy-1,4-benzoquinol methylase